MRQNGVTQSGIGESSDHRDLNRGQYFSRAGAKCGDTEDPIIVSTYQSLDEAPRFR